MPTRKQLEELGFVFGYELACMPPILCGLHKDDKTIHIEYVEGKYVHINKED